MAQVDLLLQVANLAPASRVLELGCGNGGIAAYIAMVSGAHVTGLDFSPPWMPVHMPGISIARWWEIPMRGIEEVARALSI